MLANNLNFEFRSKKDHASENPRRSMLSVAGEVPHTGVQWVEPSASPSVTF